MTKCKRDDSVLGAISFYLNQVLVLIIKFILSSINWGFYQPPKLRIFHTCSEDFALELYFPPIVMFSITNTPGQGFFLLLQRAVWGYPGILSLDLGNMLISGDWL